MEYHLNLLFYCVNTSYPMDNCFTGRRDRSRQTSEKDVLYILPAGPVTGCAFARWRIVLHFLFTPLDVIASFSFGTKECAEVFLQTYAFEVLQRTPPSFVFFISTEYFYNLTDHYVVSWTETRFLRARYGPFRQPSEMRALT